ncbi:unnamed protein product [Auanema sp. JU1783]|nr:unnamed protein product [Auanema sp. JU1783]
MQALFFASLFLFTINLVNGCTTYPDDPLRTAIVQRICELQKDVSDLYESLLKPDEVLGLQTTDAPMQKRKNEFIRFGKRGDGTVAKRKNEFIRFGKRKNEFIR